MPTALTSAHRAQAGMQAAKVYRWSRQVIGGRPVYTIYARELNKPHRFKDEVYDAARCRRILRDTLRRLPVGKVIVGHNAGREGFRVGALTNYRDRGGVTVGDLEHVEPEAFQAIALGRLDHTSVEFEYPSLEVIESVALLGSSRQFFDDFPPLRVSLTAEQWAQLKRDASEWPLPWRSRPKRPQSQGQSVNANKAIAEKRQQRFDDEDAEMDAAAAEAGVAVNDDADEDDGETGTADGGQRAMGDAGGEASGAGDAAAAAQNDFDAQLANSPVIREILSRIGALEDRDGGGAPAEPAAAPAPMPAPADQGRSKGASGKPAKRGNEARDPHALRLASLERRMDEGTYRTRLDALRSKGFACSADQEREILDAVVAKRGDEARDKAFRALTAGLPKAPLHDEDDDATAGAARVKDKGAEALRGALAKLPEAARQKVKANQAKYEAEAKELGMSLAEYLASQPVNVF